MPFLARSGRRWDSSLVGQGRRRVRGDLPIARYDTLTAEEITASYGDFSALTVPAFFIGLTAGALVLTSIYNGTGGSSLAVAVWHAAYNLSAATAAADGTIAAVSTACVIFWAVSLIQAERSGRPALGRARRV